MEAAEAEGFDVVAGDDAAVDDGVAQGVIIEPVLFGEVTGKRAGKTIACSGRIVNVFQRIGGRAEEQIVGKQQAAMLALFHDDVLRTSARIL